MKVRLTLLFLSLFLVFSQNSIGQSQSIHSTDSMTFHDMLLDARELMNEDSAASFYKIKACYSYATDLGYEAGKGLSLIELGRHSIIWKKDYNLAQRYYVNASSIFEDAGMVQEHIRTIDRISAVYGFIDGEALAIDYLLEQRDKFEGKPEYLLDINNQLGNQFKQIDQKDEAIHYFTESELAFKQIINPTDRQVKMQLSNDKNRGVVLRNDEQYDTAMFYFNRSLNGSIEIADTGWIARNYNSIAILHQQQNNYDQAIEEYKKSLELKRAIDYKDGVITSLTNLGSVYILKGDIRQGHALMLEAKEILDGGDFPSKRKLQVLDGLHDSYAALGKYELAYKYQEEFYYLLDSVESKEQAEISQNINAKYETEKNKILQEKLSAELEASNLKDEQNNEKLARQNKLLWAGLGIGFLFLIGGIYIVRANIQRKKANLQLQQMNEEVLEKNARIGLQKEQIEEKNKEIIDSITYAKRIQEAILPPEEIRKKLLPDSFVFYEPKDIVAGDFYWIEEHNGITYFAAADCTGHGVPGALVSVVCHNALNRSLFEFEKTDPAELLSQTRDLVIETFEKAGEEVKDGMDIAMVALNQKTKEIKFAGANNPLWMVSENKINSDQEVALDETSNMYFLEIKGDKQPVGKHLNSHAFNTSSLQANEGDIIYLFSDGYADQFGGEKGKKLKNKNFRKLLLDYAKKDLTTQHDLLAESFNKWKGDFEQLDDICVIGVRV